MKTLLYTKDNTVFLNSNIDEIMFGKTKASLLLEKTGFVVSKDENGDYNCFSEWKFTGTKTIQDTVYFTGPDFSGKSLTELISISFEESKTALFALCQAIVYGQRKNLQLPCNSLNGILFDGSKILFLPEETFDRCCANYGRQEYNRLQNEWRNSAASGVEAQNFILGTTAYFAACGKMPFPFTDEENHTVNIANQNYLPLEYQINGINKKLASAINKCLEGTFSGNFPISFLKNEIEGNAEHISTVSQQDFEKKAVQYWQTKQKKLSAGRKFNRSLPKIIVSLIAAIFIGILTSLIISEQGKKQTTLGLTSEETVQVFYSGIHHMNTDYMLAAAKSCPEAQSYISNIPQISITSLMRGAFNFNTGISTPENILFYEAGSEKFYGHNIYGISNFTLDGKPYTLNIPVPTKKHHPHKLTHQDGKKLFHKAKNTHLVEYYLIHTVDNIIVVDSYKTTVSLYFENEKWQVSTLSESFVSSLQDPREFSDDLKVQMAFANNDVAIAADLLKVKYKWIPTKESILEEKIRLDKIGY